MVYKNHLEKSLNASIRCQSTAKVHEIKELARSTAAEFFKGKWGKNLGFIYPIKKIARDVDLSRYDHVIATFDL